LAAGGRCAQIQAGFNARQQHAGGGKKTGAVARAHKRVDSAANGGAISMGDDEEKLPLMSV